MMGRFLVIVIASSLVFALANFPDELGAWLRLGMGWLVFILAYGLGATAVKRQRFLGSVQVVPMSQASFSPPQQTKCPCCGAEFQEADVREPADRPDVLDFHCPECTYQFARWPKNMC